MLCFSALHECVPISQTKLVPEWALIQVNFDSIQEIGQKIIIMLLYLIDGPEMLSALEGFHCC